MATIVWTEQKVIEAMIEYRRRSGRWPKSRDWWFANKGHWPSFTTVCYKIGKWNGLLRKAREIERNGESLF